MTSTGVSGAFACDRKTALRTVVLAGVSLLVTGCVSQNQTARNGRVDTFNTRYGVHSSPRVVADGQPIPRGGGVYRVGRPYTIAGRRYTPYEKREGHSEVGVASWYGRQFHGRLTANGEVYDMNALSAAHRTMPMPSYARVTNLRNGHSIIVRVNDRGPFHANRVVDLSSRASHLLDFRGHGVARVKVEYVGRAPLEGSDDRMLLATLRTDGTAAPMPSGVGAGVMVASAAPSFVPQSAPQPAVVENRGIGTQITDAMPLPPERPFDLGLAAGGATTVVASAPARQADPVVTTAAAAASTSAPTIAPVPTPSPVAAPAPTAVATAPSQPPALASASTRSATLPGTAAPTAVTSAYAAPPAQPPVIAAMPGTPAPARATIGLGSLY
ncbi:septal ring lytic transglycosylase RlpA family protein [Phreatobacter sp. AB_2022a]|uniref:septal ring lytic transglycosylase RlpA family protein n=1 Tax=Phreatobacter sp. AB_2022a TaxID=3003134 RepID=UPI002286DAA9|nr:septal ring lytic transglycosylase RlpA family protein [Phreatobacter sp. AB_2022a]MCZ0736586.1 septal ring lytic transglycosylase RlpA family protein [Phreatobacter sp. AB_2022a]